MSLFSTLLVSHGVFLLLGTCTAAISDLATPSAPANNYQAD